MISPLGFKARVGSVIRINANFVLKYICSSLHCLQFIMLVKRQLNGSLFKSADVIGLLEHFNIFYFE